MLAQNKSGWKLLEYLNVSEDRISDYENVTGSFAIIKDLFTLKEMKWNESVCGI